MKSQESLIREMHSGIAVLSSEIKNIRSDQRDIKKTLEKISEETVKQRERIRNNSDKIEEHIAYHNTLDKRSMWKIGVVLTILITCINILVKVVIQ